MTVFEKIKIALSSAAVSLTAALLYFKVYLDSDSLFLEALSTDLFSRGGSWLDWRLTPAPAYVPDMLLYFAAYPLFPTAEGRIFFVSAGQVLVLALAALWLAKKIQPRLSGHAISTTLLMVALVTLVAAKSKMWLYFYTTNNHFASLLFPMISLGLILEFMKRPAIGLALGLIFVNFVGAVSTAIHLLSFTLPVYVMLCLGLLASWNSVSGLRRYRSVLLWLFLILIGSQVCAVIFEKNLTYHSPLSGRAPGSVEAAAHSFELFLKASANAFSADNRFTRNFSLIVASAFLLLLYSGSRRIRIYAQENVVKLELSLAVLSGSSWRITFSGILLIMVGPVNIVGAVISGGFADLSGYRYFMFPVALALVLSIAVIDQWRGKPAMAFNAIYVLVFGWITFSSIQFIHKSFQLTPKVNTVAKCLEDVERSGEGVLRAGIADYWNARAVTYEMNRHVPLLATTNNMEPFFWMSSLGPLVKPARYPEYHYNFAILRSADKPDQFNYSAEAMGNLLPKPSRIHACGDGQTQVWLYQGEELHTAVMAHAREFLSRLGPLR
jgi:hypothetical protein